MAEAELTPPPPPSITTCSSPTNDGDWDCEECGNVNFARRNSCNRCSKTRSHSSKKLKLGTEIGKAAAEKSKGLFSADDWQCNKCGNVNWARRQSCNVCNAPKFGEVEERTGFGGYNDRGVVEYKEREDSDDDYDEFGRRKKRRSTSDSRSYNDDEPEPIAKTAEPEEEDEEEEDDDGDLSKYDLSDWGDANTDGKSKNRDRSRSRSPLTKKS